MFNNKNYAIMKKVYQILLKGRASNKLRLLEFNNYVMYKQTLEMIDEDKLLYIITTNMYIIE